MSVALLVPVLGRPEHIAPLAASVRATTLEPWTLFFLCSPGDTVERACRAVGDERVRTVVVPFAREHGDYARKVNYGVRITSDEWLFHGATDLLFHPNWLHEALAMQAHGRVIGTNDLGNRLVVKGKHSTHSLVHRSYVEEVGTTDEPGKMLHEGYHHNFCDTELVQTAMLRREFVFARQAVVEHLHPLWKKGQHDEVYALGLADFHRDQRYFTERRRVWHRKPARR